MFNYRNRPPQSDLPLVMFFAVLFTLAFVLYSDWRWRATKSMMMIWEGATVIGTTDLGDQLVRLKTGDIRLVKKY